MFREVFRDIPSGLRRAAKKRFFGKLQDKKKRRNLRKFEDKDKGCEKNNRREGKAF